jgi:hypothetical protein
VFASFQVSFTFGHYGGWLGQGVYVRSGTSNALTVQASAKLLS